MQPVMSVRSRCGSGDGRGEKGYRETKAGPRGQQIPHRLGRGREALLAEHAAGKRVVMVYPLDKWVLMLLTAGAEIRNLGDVRWRATEDGEEGAGAGRHIVCFILEPK